MTREPLNLLQIGLSLTRIREMPDISTAELDPKGRMMVEDW